mmetsp:Transcript_44597/g.80196  ORF Transcript_44597/g.80196 Transcript_44597/m.80196 type:complete len:318 (-) Transcript_44597:123-1076(-)
MVRKASKDIGVDMVRKASKDNSADIVRKASKDYGADMVRKASKDSSADLCDIVYVFEEVQRLGNGDDASLGLVGNISVKELQEIRSLKSPPVVVRRILEVVYLLLQTPSPKPTLPPWPKVQRFLEGQFVERLQKFQIDRLSEAPHLAEFIVSEYFKGTGSGEQLTFRRVKRANKAAAALFRWCAQQLKAVVEELHVEAEAEEEQSEEIAEEIVEEAIVEEVPEEEIVEEAPEEEIVEEVPEEQPSPIVEATPPRATSPSIVEQPKCPRGHLLQLYVEPRPGGGFCDGCWTRQPVETTVMDCRACNYYLCNQCLPIEY